MSATPPLHGPATAAGLTHGLTAHLWRATPRLNGLLWIFGLGSGLLWGGLAYTFVTGIGTWGNNIPVSWGYGITNFVWWIGIGHAGTFISAVLLLLEQKWRTSINRLAEAMTLFAVLNAGLYPIAHMGRPWFFYWLLPYPSTMGVWPQFKSPLTWDVVAITTYLAVSLLFWYVGLVPDLAVARDTAPTRLRRRVYGVFALGWSGSAHHWHHYRVIYGLMAALATPLVVSVHTVVSLDFCVTKVPGWHSTLFPPFFVAGALLSGFAMVLTLVIPVRAALGLHDVITARHLDAMAKIVLVTGSMVGYSYLVESFIAWYSHDPHEAFMYLTERPTGAYRAVYWVSVVGNVVAPQIFWWRRARQSLAALLGVALAVHLGMWSERFIIVVTSLSRDFLPASWRLFVPSVVDWALFAGTLSFFAFAFLLFLKWVP
ncbi:MAG TPA: NrfD/PsrC family molybdoenzyme membrane anchor subunit, partial [Myxococcota bacterium]|nr:NrfD/PsrC family molybdoenzyme membrane anchor subunit [Myxococcota bacterium]